MRTSLASVGHTSERTAGPPISCGHIDRSIHGHLRYRDACTSSRLVYGLASPRIDSTADARRGYIFAVSILLSPAVRER